MMRLFLRELSKEFVRGLKCEEGHGPTIVGWVGPKNHQLSTYTTIQTQYVQVL